MKTVEQSVKTFRVYEALRSGNVASLPDDVDTLHLAVQCAELPVIEHVLQTQNVNARDQDGNTPLHVAASLSRLSVVKALLQKGADDTITNYQGKTPLNLAKAPEVFQHLELARSLYVDKTVKTLQQHVAASEYDKIEELLLDEHFRHAIDVNDIENATETGTLLHEAAARKDVKLIQILLLNGADPFRRDRKGRLPQDVTKDDRTRAILKKSPAAAAAQRGIQEKTILSDRDDGKDREMKGYLKKWVNYTTGYKLRWFVLEDGVLSYYKHQDDAGSACRGAINMRIAGLHMDAQDKLRFEIIGKSLKYHLKANHQVEAKRWFWALNNAIQFGKDEAKRSVEIEDKASIDYDSDVEVEKDAFLAAAHSAKMQVDMLSQMSTSLRGSDVTLPLALQALQSYDRGVVNLAGLLDNLQRIARDRESFWQHRLEQELAVRRIWEDNMLVLAKEQEELEERMGEVEEKRKQAKRALREYEQASDSEDEFFDVEGGSVDVTVNVNVDGASDNVIVKGYEDPVRTRLKMDADNRPKISLWGILKSMIGKDMTKMTLPVSFNEPTSLLQRVAEDMEYTDLLDTAADKTDPTERMLYVAAFAASEYASTTGRVAKPFNPLLGETFEYALPAKGYRFFVEQVSHHPPIGAAWAESAKWQYYGESAVQSKFYGKSFDINPLGTWFLKMGKELYTWKKVTSSVIGIITGNPTVDNYGVMEIKNHTTGELCILDFKPRGWKSSSAFLVTGKVLDHEGKTRWSIGGRWNDKIYARNREDCTVLIWEANARPEAPFNLTPFGITLNALPDRLRPHLPPTDTRLRPDQRAMEDGEYDFAATEKNRVEEKQRAKRRERELQGHEFEPKWFTKSKCEITGEEYWAAKRSKGEVEYWRRRQDHDWSVCEDIF